MSTLNNRNWAVVGRSSNPIPGDPVAIDELARKYSKLSTSFADMSSALKKLGNSAGMEGKWVSKFEEKARSLPSDFENFASGFSTVNVQLKKWSDELEKLQNQAIRELNKADTARASLSRARGQQDAADAACRKASKNYYDLPQSATQQDRSQAQKVKDTAAAELKKYTKQVSAAQADIDDATIQIETVIIPRYEAIGDGVASSISRAKTITPRVSGFEKFHYSDRWQEIVSVVKVVSYALAIASLFISGWGIGLAVVLVGGFLLADKIADYALGDASLKEVIAEGVFFVLSVFGSMRAISAGVKRLKGAKAFTSSGFTKSLVNFSKASANTIRNIRNCHSLNSFGILLRASGFLPSSSKFTKSIVGLAGVAGDYKKGKKVFDSVQIIVRQANKWKTSGHVAKTVLYYAGRTHLLQKVANASFRVKPFVMNPIKYGNQTIGPVDILQKFVPGYSQWNNATKIWKSGGDAVTFGASANRAEAGR